MTGAIVLNPDEEVRARLHLVFAKFRELQSARGVMRFLCRNRLPLPVRPVLGPFPHEVVWREADSARVRSILQNPAYAGAYVYGRREKDPSRCRPGSLRGTVKVASFYIRFEESGLAERLDGLAITLPLLIVYAAIIYWFFDLYRSKWRFASVPDLANILRASTVLALSLLVVDYILVAPNIRGSFFFGKMTIVLYWMLQMFFLGGPRLAYCYFRLTRTRQHAAQANAPPTLVLGRAADTEAVLRAVESGSVNQIRPVGILSPSFADQGQTIRGVSVLGNFDDLERAVAETAEHGTAVRRLVLTASAFEPGTNVESVIMQARRLGLIASRVPSLDEGDRELRLAPVNVEDLLLRSSVKIDYGRLESFIKGRAVIVTGGGGSIGSEICERAVTFGATRLLVIENSEPALHKILEALRNKRFEAKIEGRLADVRDRERIIRLICNFKPDVVFHAAALKHVPLLERDWGEGIKTNVFGSVNVADAAVAAGAAGLVMISTDKAIEPVSVLGATKRIAEMYCQAVDADVAQRAGAGRPPMRLISVRFGNVLASNGSVVPKFRAQIEAGGPIMVTHPDMVRYFMTIREACDLVVTAASHAFGSGRVSESVFVLNMGQPVKIVDLAERMIRLSGLEPHRDIEIVYTGMRPGERLYEVLFAQEEARAEIGIEGVLAAGPLLVPIDSVRELLRNLEKALIRDDPDAFYEALRTAVPDFHGAAA
jgi:O-antigen biosynthesis protein WbqV